MALKKKTTWLLVGDGASAQFYSVHAVPLRVAKVPQGTLKATGKNSRGAEHHPDTRHIAHNTSGRAVGQRHENVFIESVAAKVDEAASSGKVDDLIIVLPPKALAHFRKTVGPRAQKKIKQEICGEWMQLAMPDIEKNLAAHLP